MKRIGCIVALVILAALFATALPVFAGDSGRSCTDVHKPTNENRYCVDGGDKTVFYFAYTLCEDCRKKSSCDDTKVYCRMIIAQFVNEGESQCEKIEALCWQAVNGCAGHIPPSGPAWDRDDSLL